MQVADRLVGLVLSTSVFSESYISQCSVTTVFLTICVEEPSKKFAGSSPPDSALLVAGMVRIVNHSGAPHATRSGDKHERQLISRAWTAETFRVTTGKGPLPIRCGDSSRWASRWILPG